MRFKAVEEGRGKMQMVTKKIAHNRCLRTFLLKLTWMARNNHLLESIPNIIDWY